MTRAERRAERKAIQARIMVRVWAQLAAKRVVKAQIRAEGLRLCEFTGREITIRLARSASRDVCRSSGESCSVGLRSRAVGRSGPATRLWGFALALTMTRRVSISVSWLRLVYCRWPVAWSLSATLQKQFF
jgi:hypothetical protein